MIRSHSLAARPIHIYIQPVDGTFSFLRRQTPISPPLLSILEAMACLHLTSHLRRLIWLFLFPALAPFFFLSQLFFLMHFTDLVTTHSAKKTNLKNHGRYTFDSSRSSRICITCAQLYTRVIPTEQDNLGRRKTCLFLFVFAEISITIDSNMLSILSSFVFFRADGNLLPSIPPPPSFLVVFFIYKRGGIAWPSREPRPNENKKHKKKER